MSPNNARFFQIKNETFRTLRGRGRVSVFLCSFNRCFILSVVFKISFFASKKCVMVIRSGFLYMCSKLHSILFFFNFESYFESDQSGLLKGQVHQEPKPKKSLELNRKKLNSYSFFAALKKNGYDTISRFPEKKLFLGQVASDRFFPLRRHLGVGIINLAKNRTTYKPLKKCTVLFKNS